MKRLLVISWEMPPLSGPRAVQVTRTLTHLVPLGWHSTVICFGPQSNRYNQDYRVPVGEDTDGAVRLVPVASLEERFLFRALWRVCPPLKRLPDEKRVWMPAALSAARRELAAGPYDAVVSFAQPWTDHLIGLRLHRETALPWVAHFSDPWLDSPYQRGPGWQRRLWARMERDVLAAATRVVFVNDQTARRTLATYPADWWQRVRVVPQGYDRPMADAPRGDPSDRPLRMVYTGRFYPVLRTPDAFLDALAVLNRRSPLERRLEVEIVGGDMEAHERRARALELEKVVHFAGRQSPAQATARAASADVLLLIDTATDGPGLFLPSKLIEYLPLNRVIFGITPQDGPSAALLRQLGDPVVAPNNVTAIADAVEALLAAHASGALTPSPGREDVRRAYDIRETTRAFDAVLREAIGH